MGPTTDPPTAAEPPILPTPESGAREHGFDDFAEAQCATFYAETMGRLGLPPGIYFRLLLIGYFEGIDSERGIAWRAADSFALRDFLGVGLEDAPPDHSTISRTRRLIDLDGYVYARLKTPLVPRAARRFRGLIYPSGDCSSVGRALEVQHDCAADRSVDPGWRLPYYFNSVDGQASCPPMFSG